MHSNNGKKYCRLWLCWVINHKSVKLLKAQTYIWYKMKWALAIFLDQWIYTKNYIKYCMGPEWCWECPVNPKRYIRFPHRRQMRLVKAKRCDSSSNPLKQVKWFSGNARFHIIFLSSTACQDSLCDLVWDSQDSLCTVLDLDQSLKSNCPIGQQPDWQEDRWETDSCGRGSDWHVHLCVFVVSLLLVKSGLSIISVQLERREKSYKNSMWTWIWKWPTFLMAFCAWFICSYYSKGEKITLRLQDVTKSSQNIYIF